MDERMNIAREMVYECERVLGKDMHDIILMGIRAVCRYYGGQMIFLPKYKADDSDVCRGMKRVLRGAVGKYSNAMLSILMQMFGGVSIYIPMEVRAFKKEVSREIRNRYDGKIETGREICREYKISFTQMYRLWHKGGREDNQGGFKF